MDVMIVESLFGTHGIDTTEFVRGDAIEDTCREQLPADRLILRR
jgi:hypothetical protein